MKAALLCLSFLLAWAGASSSAQEIPSWTNTSGATILGEFVRLDGQAVVIRKKEGAEFKIPFSQLSGDSIVRAEKLAAAAGPVSGVPEHPSVPAHGAWKKGVVTGFPKLGLDRVFLIDRGWVEGKLSALNPTSVSMRVGGETLRFPRNTVSLIGLSDWIAPVAASKDRLVKLRITLSGTAECATLLLTGGAIIHSVDVPPQWKRGTYQAAQASANCGGISFDKGSNRSEFDLITDVTVLLPPTGPLRFEIVNNRSNGFSGPLSVSISHIDSATEIASSKQASTGMWHRFEVPRDKLLAGSGGLRIAPSGAPTFKRGDIPSLNLPALPPREARRGTARVIGPDCTTIGCVKLDSIDLSVLRMAGRTGTNGTLLRENVCWIELNDWQLEWLPTAVGAESSKAVPGVSRPLRFRSFGISGHNAINFQENVCIESLIVPPYYLFGLDPNDGAEVGDDHSVNYDRCAMDQSPFHAEFVANLRIGEPDQIFIDFHNHYTNVHAGPLEVEIEPVLAGRKIADHQSADLELNRVEKFQSSRFLGN